MNYASGDGLHFSGYGVTQAVGVNALVENPRKTCFSDFSEADKSNSGIPTRSGSNIALSPMTPSLANPQNRQRAAVVMQTWSNLENLRFL